MSALIDPSTVLLLEFIVTNLSVLLFQSPKQLAKLFVTVHESVFIPLPGHFSLHTKRKGHTGQSFAHWEYFTSLLPFNITAGCGCNLTLLLLCQEV